VIAGFGRILASAARQRWQGAPEQTQVPGPAFSATLPPRDPKLVADYLRWCGGDASAWRGRVPHHMFAQWGFGVLPKTLEGISYPVAKALNAGCRMEIEADIPLDSPLHVTAQLVNIDDDGRRVILTQRLTTALPDGTRALTADVSVFIPLASKPSSDRPKTRRPKPTVPADARELSFRRYSGDDGFRFACLTGDFNPVHWVTPYAQMAGFGRRIMHGFGTLGRSLETLNRTLWAGDTRHLKTVDVRFTKPLKLPGKAGVYVRGSELYAGSAAGGEAYLSGTFTTQDQGLDQAKVSSRDG
jgi:acyl dehydratase